MRFPSSIPLSACSMLPAASICSCFCSQGSSAMAARRAMAGVFVFVAVCLIPLRAFAQENSTEASASSPISSPPRPPSPAPSDRQRQHLPADASFPSAAPPPPETLESDRYALLKLKALLKNPPLIWNGSDPCVWDGIGCTEGELNRRVISVSLSNRDLTGSLPDEVGLLTALEFFDISFSNFGGPLPKELGNLTRLNKMYFGRNNFSGPIPPELGNLRLVQDLTIDRNEITGPIPPELGNLASVQYLDLSFNPYLVSKLPIEIGNCTNLRRLFLGSVGLFGEIPDMFGRLRFLNALALDNNNLTGKIPDSLGILASQSNFHQVNLANNNLSGYFPTSLVTNTNHLSYSGNPLLCNERAPDLPSCPPGTPMPDRDSPNTGGTENKSGNTTVVVAILLSTIFAVALLGTLLWCYFKGRHRFTPFLRGYSSTGRAPHGGGGYEARLFKTRELQVITANWKRVIGRGGFGPVYLGVFSDSTKVAIKKLQAHSSQGATEFISEVDLLRRLHHRYLVNLVGWCDEEEKFLVYEYKDNGSLSSVLYRKGEHDRAEVPALTWNTRMQIIVDVARGLDYLHHGATPPVIHRDIKSDNILLDQEFCASVADFGISKAGGGDQATTVVKGTLGYLDPEYQRTHIATFASDVYSFGILMLEIVTGRRPIDPTLPVDKINLRDWALAKMTLEDIEGIVDPSLESYNRTELSGILEITKECLRERKLRPSMRKILHRLEELSTGGLKTMGNMNDGKGTGPKGEEDYSERGSPADGSKYEMVEMDLISITGPAELDLGISDTMPLPR